MIILETGVDLPEYNKGGIVRFLCEESKNYLTYFICFNCMVNLENAELVMLPGKAPLKDEIEEYARQSWYTIVDYIRPQRFDLIVREYV